MQPTKKISASILWLSLIFSLNACAPPANYTGKGGLYGAMGGAAAGAIIGQAIGHDTKATLEGAAIGAAIGGLSGAGFGHYMDRQEQALRNVMASSEAASIQRQGETLSVCYSSDYLFDVNSSVLTPGAYRDIDRLAGILRQYPGTIIRIEGHTDNTGPERYNLVLSQQRAEAVKRLLTGRGINPSRIITTGYGESMPKADNRTSWGRQINRRVEIRIEPSGSSV